MQKKMIIITPKDIQRITGYSYKTSARLHHQIREHLGKHSNQFITIDDFCAFTGLTRENVETILEE